MMQPYPNLSNGSGVSAYEIGADYIIVQFHRGRPYRYSYASAGEHHVERMKELAASGRGLSTYISQHVHNQYER
jgi:hypothetical protein